MNIRLVSKINPQINWTQRNMISCLSVRDYMQGKIGLVFIWYWIHNVHSQRVKSVIMEQTINGLGQYMVINWDCSLFSTEMNRGLTTMKNTSGVQRATGEMFTLSAVASDRRSLQIAAF